MSAKFILNKLKERGHMNFQEKVKAHLHANPDVKQITVRISKGHSKKLNELAKKYKMKPGVFLRLLSEWAIEQHSDQAVDQPDHFVSRSEFDQLKAEVEALRAAKSLPEEEEKG